MTRSKARRPRLGMTWFALALGALALLAMPGLASAKDRNHDHIPDKWEKRHKLSLKVNQARKDQDGDHLRNRAEFLAGDNPRDKDSNDDGVTDGEENAGTIASFDAETGKLTIDLFGDESISGFVTEETEIKCEDSAGASVSSDGESGESGESTEDGEEVEAGDDHGGEGEEEPGDDHGGQGEEPGDDNGGDGGGNCTAADLVPGAVVQEAELQISGGKAVFEEVELSGKEA
ncbi:MAG TPA: hypothetical protein VFI17_05005 [Solirubrobacterales bacterium]|nr:hypothetical protein [Solirubrobacterales bacterium]